MKTKLIALFLLTCMLLSYVSCTNVKAPAASTEESDEALDPVIEVEDVIDAEEPIPEDTPVDVTFTYNLATYAQSGVSGDVGTALYAYAKEAYAYGYKHTVGTIE